MPGSAAQICLNVWQCIICINESNISVTPVCLNEALDRTLLVHWSINIFVGRKTKITCFHDFNFYAFLLQLSGEIFHLMVLKEIREKQKESREKQVV